MTIPTIGAFSDVLIRQLIEKKFIVLPKRLPKGEERVVQPASLDISLSGEVFEIPRVFSVPRGKTVWEMVKLLGPPKEYPLTMPLFPGRIYLAKVATRVSLPVHVYGFGNGKSSTARIDVSSRFLADNVSRYDELPSDYKESSLWVMIRPQSWQIVLHEGVALNQLRFFNGDTRLSEDELENLMQESEIVSVYDTDAQKFKTVAYKDLQNRDGRSIPLSLGFRFKDNKFAGFVGKKCSDPIVLAEKGTHDWQKYFDPIEVKNGMIEIDEDKFYILSTLEATAIPNGYTAELKEADPRLGDMLVHCAGFGDSGFNQTWTLEVRSQEKRVLIEGQPISRVRYEKTCVPSDSLYGKGIGSNYPDQTGPRLAKFFTTPA